MLRNLFRIRLTGVKNVLPKINIVPPCSNVVKVKILPENKSFKNYGRFLIGAGVFTWLGFGKNENVEDDIILNIKRSILWIQQKEYEKAEQMLHISLRLAQQTFNDLAITYVYDIMANLALQRNQLDKAEKLFVSVMQRLLSSGVAESDNRNVHISLKLAHICHLKGDLDKSVIGFEWALDHLERKKRDSIDTLTLFGLGKDWYGHLLYDLKRYEESLTNLSEAFDILNEVQEENFEQIIILLNDMAAANEKLNRIDKAIELLEKSVVIAKKNPEINDVGTIHVNLGRLFMRKGLYEKAKKSCGKGFRYSVDSKNKVCKEEASQCIKEALKFIS